MYSIIYGRLIGKHFVDYTDRMDFKFTDEQKANLNQINADFISNYKEVLDDDKMDGFHTSSVIFKEKLISYEDLVIGALYFLLADDENNVLYFEKLNGEREEIYIKVGEEIFDLPPAPTL